jgi:hypothetical protein
MSWVSDGLFITADFGRMAQLALVENTIDWLYSTPAMSIT